MTRSGEPPFSPRRKRRKVPRIMGDTDPNGTTSAPVAGAPMPPVGEGTNDTPATQAPPEGEATTTPALTPEQLTAELAKVRREAAGYRTKLKTFEDQAAQEAAAKLSDLEKAQMKVADLEKALGEQTRREQERTVRYEIQAHAAKLGIIDPEAAYALMDRAQLDYTDDGAPKNVNKLLKELIASKPYLAGPVAQGSAANPARNPAQAGTYTESQIAAMTPAEYQQHKAAIWQAQKEGRVLKG